MATRKQKRMAHRPAARRRGAATTADIVGNAPAEKLPPVKWRKHYRHLVQLRSALLRKQDELVRDANEMQPVPGFHLADAGTDSFDRDLALSRISLEQNAVYEIDDALNRIRDGSYGICELTGKLIELRRLEVIPWTRFSAEAEKTLEREGIIRRPHLAPREPMISVRATETAEDEAESELEVK